MDLNFFDTTDPLENSLQFVANLDFLTFFYLLQPLSGLR